MQGAKTARPSSKCMLNNCCVRLVYRSLLSFGHVQCLGSTQKRCCWAGNPPVVKGRCDIDMCWLPTHSASESHLLNANESGNSITYEYLHVLIALDARRLVLAIR